MTTNRTARPDLREACLGEALALIAEHGVEQLSLRDVARRLGVSHQAPYKHFPSRDHMLAEVIARCFDDFAAALEAALAGPEADPWRRLCTLGLAYFDYARDHPLHYRLMFGTPLPPKADHAGMMHSGRHAFSLLERAIGAMPLKPAAAPSVALDALFVWSTIHGLATILQSNALRTLGLSEAERHDAISHCLDRIGLALQPD